MQVEQQNKQNMEKRNNHFYIMEQARVFANEQRKKESQIT